jgi:thioredoxin-like negative regulator of GroEL
VRWLDTASGFLLFWIMRKHKELPHMKHRKRLCISLSTIHYSLLTFFCALVIGAPAARAQDEITYYDRAMKKEAKATGAIQSENPGEIVIKPATGVGSKNIPAIDVLDVFYNVPQRHKLDYRSAINREGAAEKATKEADRKKELGAALTKYQDLLGNLTDAKVKRHLQFKIAKVMALQAEEEGSGVEAAVDKLRLFLQENRQCWQVTQCSELLARFQIKRKDWEGAQKTYEDLAATMDISGEIKLEAELKAAQMMVRAKKFSNAQKKLDGLVKEVAPDSPQAVRLQMSQAEIMSAEGKTDVAVKKLEGILAQATDPDLKALAYNTLGDCYQDARRNKDALYSYLWVDVIYHQNRQEHARAVYHLAKLFKELKDDKRAQQYREKLESTLFAGSEYQKMLAGEK